MNLTMRCQHCSASKQVECFNTHSASNRIETAKANGWYAHMSKPWDGAKVMSVPLYFCSSNCEHSFKVKTRTHLEIVGRVSR